MRIAYVSTRSDTIGGSNVHIRDLALALRSRGHDVLVIGGGAGPWADEIRASGLTYRSVRRMQREIHPIRDAAAVIDVRKALRAFRPDLVSLHTAKAGVVGRVAALGLRLPVVYTPHGWTFTTGIPSASAARYAALERLVAPLAARIVNVCAFEREIAVDRRVGRPEQHAVVPNGMPDVAPDLRATPERQPPRLVMVARFEEPKDHALLLSALVSLEALPWELQFVGSGPLEGAVLHACHEHGLDERVVFLGARRDVADILADAQAFVLCTRWEGFPRSILEAMRAGLPVVASAVGGVREAVIEGVTGRVVPPGDVAALTDALGAVLGDPTRRASMGRAGRARYEAEFTFDQMLERTLGVYRAVVPGTW